MSRHQIKKKRLEATYMEVISQAVLFQVDDPRLDGNQFTISRVEVSDDFTEANVYFSTYSDINPNKITKALFSAGPLFLNILKSKIKIKFLPKLKFHFDKKSNEANDVLDLIHKISKDLESDSS